VASLVDSCLDNLSILIIVFTAYFKRRANPYRYPQARPPRYLHATGCFNTHRDAPKHAHTDSHLYKLSLSQRAS
jgi:hypothetical protein